MCRKRKLWREVFGGTPAVLARPIRSRLRRFFARYCPITRQQALPSRRARFIATGASAGTPACTRHGGGSESSTQRALWTAKMHECASTHTHTHGRTQAAVVRARHGFPNAPSCVLLGRHANRAVPSLGDSLHSPHWLSVGLCLRSQAAKPACLSLIGQRPPIRASARKQPSQRRATSCFGAAARSARTQTPPLPPSPASVEHVCQADYHPGLQVLS